MIPILSVLAGLALATASAPADGAPPPHASVAAKKAAPNKVVPNKANPSKADPSKAGPNKAGPNKVAAKKAEPVKKAPADKQAAADKKPVAGKKPVTDKKTAANKKPAANKPDGTPKSEAAARVAEWVAASGDNHSLPYVIVDKNAARVFLFSAKGKQLADAPVLIGVALGDEATPGVGAKSLAEIGPAEKTTPAGRFLAKFGLAAGHQQVLWVDYATSVALHPIPPGNKEHRSARMLSPTIDDNRITFGCINVPKKFYSGVSPLFAKKGGYVYVLPDTRPLEDVFPPLHAQPFLNRGVLASAAADGAGERADPTAPVDLTEKAPPPPPVSAPAARKHARSSPRSNVR